jgi:hypothetical protein
MYAVISAMTLKVAELTFSQLTDIPPFIPQLYSFVLKKRINFPEKDFKVFVPRVGLVSYNFSFVAGPIKNEYLTKILEYLFPDSSSTSDHAYPREFERAQSLEGVSTIGIKSAPVDGLVWRLTIVLVSML